MIVKGILPVSFCDIYSMSKVLFCHFGLHSSEGKRMRDSERETERESASMRNKDGMSSLILQAGSELLLAWRSWEYA